MRFNNPLLKKIFVVGMSALVLLTSSVAVITPKTAQAVDTSKEVCSAITGAVGGVLGGIANGDIGGTIDTIKNTIISVGLDALTGPLAGVVTGALGSVFGGLFGGGSKQVPGTEDEPVTVKTKCDILDKRTALEQVNRTLTQRIVNDLVRDYKIQDYYRYGQNLAYKVYLVKQIVKRGREDQVLITANARQILGLTEGGRPDVDLIPLYTRKALAYTGICRAGTIDPACSNTGADVDSPSLSYSSQDLNKFVDPIQSTAQGQKLAFEDESFTKVSASQAATAADVANGNGNKDSFDCADSSQEETLTDCNIENPGSLAKSAVDAHNNAAANYQLNPPEWKNVVGSVLSNAVTGYLKSKLLSGSSRGNFLDYLLAP